MKKHLSLLLMLLALNMSYAQYYPIDVAKLNSSYEALMKDSLNAKAQKDFFAAFPSTWMEYIMTYQYIPDPGYDLTMYSACPKHMEALEKRMSIVPDSVYYPKIVGLALGGRWGADAPNYLKALLHSKMKSNPDCMLQEVSKLTKGAQMEFWQFYWSNICAASTLEREYALLVQSAKAHYPATVAIMEDAFKYFYNGVDASEDYPFRKNKLRIQNRR